MDKYIQLFLLIIIISACTKQEDIVEDQQPTTTIEVDSSNKILKENYLFGKGSYWVYQNSSGITKRIATVNSYNYVQTHTWRRGSSHTQYLISDFGSFSYIILNTKLVISWSGGRKSDHRTLQPILNIATQGTDPIKVGDSLFSNVTLGGCFGKFPKSDLDYSTNFFFVPKLGIVRFETTSMDTTKRDRETWELIKYSVNLVP